VSCRGLLKSTLPARNCITPGSGVVEAPASHGGKMPAGQPPRKGYCTRAAGFLASTLRADDLAPAPNERTPRTALRPWRSPWSDAGPGGVSRWCSA
jgi:hypothetical protein